MRGDSAVTPGHDSPVYLPISCQDYDLTPDRLHRLPLPACHPAHPCQTDLSIAQHEDFSIS